MFKARDRKGEYWNHRF